MAIFLFLFKIIFLIILEFLIFSCYSIFRKGLINMSIGKANNSLLWFDDPNNEITITNDVMRNKLRKMFMEAISNNHKYMLHDSILSDYLSNEETEVEVCYTIKSKQKPLIESINKKCNLSIDTNIIALKMHINDDIFILASSSRNLSRKDASFYCNCMQVQGDYFEKHDIWYPATQKPYNAIDKIYS